MESKVKDFIIKNNYFADGMSGELFAGLNTSYYLNDDMCDYSYKNEEEFFDYLYKCINNQNPKKSRLIYKTNFTRGFKH